MSTVENRAAAPRKRPHDTLPLRLVMMRTEQGLSQKAAAFRCGITPRVWQGMEEGRNTANLLDLLRTISAEFGYELDWLAWGGPLSESVATPPPSDDDRADASNRPVI